jgi:hypothetical protein
LPWIEASSRNGSLNRNNSRDATFVKDLQTQIDELYDRLSSQTALNEALKSSLLGAQKELQYV